MEARVLGDLGPNESPGRRRAVSHQAGRDSDGVDRGGGGGGSVAVGVQGEPAAARVATGSEGKLP